LTKIFDTSWKRKHHKSYEYQQVRNPENCRLHLENMKNLTLWNHIVNQQQNNPNSPFGVSYQIKQTKEFRVGDLNYIGMGFVG
jgi:hypothetical protein